MTCCYHPFRRNGVQEVCRFDFIPCLSKGFLEEIPCVSFPQRKFARGLKDGFAGDATVINPEISSGLPLPSVNRYPQPASRPEKYSTPATKGACLDSGLYRGSVSRVGCSLRSSRKPLLETRRPEGIPKALGSHPTRTLRFPLANSRETRVRISSKPSPRTHVLNLLHTKSNTRPRFKGC